MLALKGGEGYCWAHDTRPAIIERRERACALGGFTTAKRFTAYEAIEGIPAPKDAGSALTCLSLLFERLMAAKLDPQRFNSAVQGLYCFKGLFEVAELERRIKALEAAAAERGRRQP